MRSRVRPKCSATSSSVRSPPPSSPKRSVQDRALALVEHRQHLGDLARQQRRRRVRRTGRSRCGPRRSRRARRRRRHGRARRARRCRPRSGAPRRPCRAGARLRPPARRASACGRASPRAAARILSSAVSMSPACTGSRIDACRVGDAALDRLADPPRRVRRELEALAPVELVDGVDEAEVALLHDVEQRADPSDWYFFAIDTTSRRFEFTNWRCASSPWRIVAPELAALGGRELLRGLELARAPRCRPRSLARGGSRRPW